MTSPGNRAGRIMSPSWARASRREDFDDQVGGTLDGRLTDDVSVGSCDDDDISLNDIGLAEDDVDGRDEDFARTMMLYVCAEERGEPDDDALVGGRRSGRHVEVTPEDLLAGPVIGHLQIVLIGENQFLVSHRNR